MAERVFDDSAPWGQVRYTETCERCGTRHVIEAVSMHGDEQRISCTGCAASLPIGTPLVVLRVEKAAS